MNYTAEEILQYCAEEDVKFIRLAFCDAFGVQKNISIMPTELRRAFEQGIGFDASAVKGFANEAKSDLLLFPDPNTLSVLPWRPEHGRVVRMFCSIRKPGGKPFECDTRSLLIKAVEDAKAEGLEFSFGSELEFYLFKLDDNGIPTTIPYDSAGYMDIAPDDRGENIRRQICLTLEQMGISPESSHHEEGPGQNEIDFHYADALKAADDAMAFKTVVKTVAHANGLFADFSPKPLADKPGSGYHINLSVKHDKNHVILPAVIAGILEKIEDITLFLDPTAQSYKRLGSNKAPKFISWSGENRSQLVRIPAAEGEYRRAELRSPDPSANPYLAFTLLIYAGLYGYKNGLFLPPVSDIDFFKADKSVTDSYKQLPGSLEEARKAARNSAFVREHLPQRMTEIYCG
ncbi:MAG: glutamine synthetase [Ruminococcus sp.]|nr:glutamine synthetase [Ruminococcus sp.]MBR1393940.1 glutamine synthetase [Ruminococcus sp.]